MSIVTYYIGGRPSLSDGPGLPNPCLMTENQARGWADGRKGFVLTPIKFDTTPRECTTGEPLRFAPKMAEPQNPGGNAWRMPWARKTKPPAAKEQSDHQETTEEEDP